MVNQAGQTVDCYSRQRCFSNERFCKRPLTPQSDCSHRQRQRRLGSWPIAGYTYTILHMTSMTDCVKAQKLVSFVNWFLTDPGAAKQATTIGFVSLPIRRAQKVLAKLGQVTCNGQALMLK